MRHEATDAHTTNEDDHNLGSRYVVHVAVDLSNLREDARTELQLQEPHPNALEQPFLFEIYAIGYFHVL